MTKPQTKPTTPEYPAATPEPFEVVAPPVAPVRVPAAPAPAVAPVVAESAFSAAPAPFAVRPTETASAYWIGVFSDAPFDQFGAGQLTFTKYGTGPTPLDERGNLNLGIPGLRRGAVVMATPQQVERALAKVRSTFIKPGASTSTDRIRVDAAGNRTIVAPSETVVARWDRRSTVYDRETKASTPAPAPLDLLGGAWKPIGAYLFLMPFSESWLTKGTDTKHWTRAVEPVALCAPVIPTTTIPAPAAA